MATVTTLQVGTYAALTDSFTTVLDLNDRTTFVTQGADLGAPEKVYIQTWNIRYSGAQTNRWQYKNRPLTVKLYIQGATVNALMASIHTLYGAIEDPVGSPYVLKVTPAGGTNTTYWNVVKVEHVEPYDALRIQQGYQLNVTIDFEVLPTGFSIPRQWLNNLAPNPGFEGNCGGAASPPVLAFSDAFANVNAYAVQAGGSPTTAPANTWRDVVLANIPAGGSIVRWHPLGLADDSTHAYDIAGGGKTATPTGSPTQAVAGLISGDTDTCYTLASASSQWVNCPTGTDLPTGNASISFFTRLKFAANPGATMYLGSFGASGGATNHGNVKFGITSTGKLYMDNGSTAITGGTTVTTGAGHDCVVTWDGTTFTLYLDAVSQGTITPGNQTIAASPGLNIGVIFGAGNFWNGQIDEFIVYAGALSGAQVTNLHTAAASGAAGTLANAASFPAASRVAFGSPAWGALQTLQYRFRYVTSQSVPWYLHYTDANNNLQVQTASGANGFKLIHTIAGVATTLAQTTAPLQHEAWYWLQIAQFPTTYANAPYLGVTLSYDSNGTVGSTLATLGARANDALTAELGRPQIAPTGAAVVLGGVASGLGLACYLGGPGGWLGVTSQNAATGRASFAWEAQINAGGSGNTGNTYTGGPVTSYGCARIDLPPAGTVDATWHLYAGGAPGGTWAVPVAAATDVLNISAWAKSNGGLSGTAAVKLSVVEYDASGALLRTDTGWTPPSKTAAQTASWVQLQGTYTTGANCAYVDVALRVTDSTANSANGIVWFDNVLIWDQTSTGQASMPYCELRFPASPCQLLVSGILGDTAANAYMGFGAYFASMPTNTVLTFLIGRRAVAHKNTQLIGPAAGDIFNVSTFAVDPLSYGGYYMAVAANSGFSWNYGSTTFHPADMLGTYHQYARLLTQRSAGGLPNQQAWFKMIADLNPFLGQLNNSGTDGINSIDSVRIIQPLASSAVWSAVDHGQMVVPLAPGGALSDPSLSYLTPLPTFYDGNGGNAQAQVNWLMSLPVDSDLLIGTCTNNTGVFSFAITAKYVFVYTDGMGVNGGAAPSWLFSTETAAIPNPGRGAGGPGWVTSTNTPSFITVNPVANEFLRLDPKITTPGSSGGVNHVAALLTDAAGTVYPFIAEIRYSPAYLYFN